MGCVTKRGEPAEAVRRQRGGRSDHAEAAWGRRGVRGRSVDHSDFWDATTFEDHSAVRESDAPDATPPHVAD